MLRSVLRPTAWCLIAVLLCGLADLGRAQQREGAKKGDKVHVKTAALLDERLEMKELQQQPVSLKDLVSYLNEFLIAQGTDRAILIDRNAFKAEFPDAPDVLDTMVSFPAFPKKMTLGEILRIGLKGIPTSNATFVVLPERIEITTFTEASAEKRLQQQITATFDNRKLSDVLRELSEKFGTTIVIDKRAAGKEEQVVSATFLNDVTLAGALRVLTEMCELKVLVLDGAIYVTTPQHAEVLRKEKLKMDQDLSPLWPIFPDRRLNPAAVAP
jgi:hypothetical protein